MKTVIFPFDETFLPVLQNEQSLLSDKDIFLLSPEGWGLKGKTYYIKGKEYCVHIRHQISDEKVDMILVNSKVNISLTALLGVIGEFDIHNIYVLKHLEEQEKKILYKRYDESQIINCDIDAEEFNKEEILFDFDVPIVLVAGAMECTNKFDTQLNIYSRFVDRGYKTGLVATKKEAVLCGAKAIPDFMYDKTVSMKDKTILFNHFLKHYEVTMAPEIIFVGVPGEVMAFSERYLGHIGEMAYIISQAVPVSEIVMCVMYEENLGVQVQTWRKSVSPKLGREINYFAMTNRLLDLNELYASSEIKYTTISPDLIKSKNNFETEKIYILFEPSEVDRLVADLIEGLSND